MEIYFSDNFRKDYRRIRDPLFRKMILEAVRNLGNFPESGIPLMDNLKDYRRLFVKPFRIIYRIDENRIYIR